MELPDEIYDRIIALSEKGDAYAENEQFASALAQYQQALALLPEPKTDWEAATWLYAAIGDAYLNKQQPDDALNAYEQALQSPDGTGNAYIWFSIGQVYYEQGNIAKAKQHFMSAYILDGHTIFEDEKPEYFALLRTEVESAEPPTDSKSDANLGNKNNSWLPPDWNKN
ncbi:tetratricopeptide repeat protein [Mucilaginibacter sp. Bleaf8]|uniref:tetratricopeptide repeat protein n=1 Tax=Mucilaginibacter sp. Bleaf8 TaxID=2834430 RepID=UPI001BCD5A09|nr:tetratricopeptide repeat protein [Mucilaginibacter sp. Bleaf8]MBS7566738.1 tetratricopeptide repeat protein [Mucilaginibacter sp. Bleaf8]